MLLSAVVFCLFAYAAVASGAGWFFVLGYVGFIGVILSSVIAIYWHLVVQRVRGIGGHNWPTIRATIDDFTVVEDEIPGRGRSVPIYLVTLQYVFHNPEIQVGDYSREFEERGDALAWANSFKGCTVMVHVNPKDPTKSVLRKEELDDAVFPSESAKAGTVQ
jgi:hypothetical protein